jgi:hypothetical protein
MCFAPGRAVKLDNKDNHSSSARLSWLWCIAIILVVALVIGGYRWNRARMWTISDRDGRAMCRVQVGWTEQEVALHCGIPLGRGQQPKVPVSGTGPFDVGMCSAPGDVYGAKVVLYGCDGKVKAVENMPAQGLVYPLQ